MELTLRVKHIIYLINSEHSWFPQTSYPVLPNAYHYILVRVYPDNNHVEIIGTKNPNKSFVVKDNELTARTNSVLTYVLYFN
jgi:hypothetical protein